MDGSIRRRILVVAPQPFYEDRGTPICVRHLLEALTALGWRVDLLTFPVGRDLPIPGVRTFRCANPLGIRHVPIGFSLRKLALDVTLTWSLAARLRSERYAYVHAVEESAFPAVALSAGRVPVVYDMQSSLPEHMSKHGIFRVRPVQAALRACERWLLRRVSLVTASAGLAQHVSRQAPSTRVREWHFPGDFNAASASEARALRADLGISAAAPVVLYSGTFAFYQGLRTLLAAVPGVLAAVPGTVFVLVGADGAEGEEIARRSTELGLDASVRIVKQQPRERLPAFLALADVLVSPRNHGANLPLKIFDYLAAGKPIVATDIATHRALLDETRAVLVAPEPEAMAKALASVLTDTGRAHRLGEAAQAHARRNFGWTAFVDSVGEIAHLGAARA